MLDGIDITDMPPYERPINMMFQSYALFPHMTVAQNIAFGLKQDRLPAGEIDARVEEMLKLVHMTQYAKRKPHQLSGGQRQRVALARSLAKRPKLLLLDEPMGALDKKLRSQMQLELVEIIERVGVTCVMVTHDQEEAMTMAQRIAIMHLGWIAQIGSPVDIYEAPVSRLVVRVHRQRQHLRQAPWSTTRKATRCITCADLEPQHLRGLRRHHLGGGQVGDLRHPPGKAAGHAPPMPTCAYNWSSGKVHDIAYLGGHSVFYVELPSGKIVQSFMANAERRGCATVLGRHCVRVVGRRQRRGTAGMSTSTIEHFPSSVDPCAAQRSQAGDRHSLPLAVPVFHAAVFPGDEDQLLRSRPSRFRRIRRSTASSTRNSRCC